MRDIDYLPIPALSQSLEQERILKNLKTIKSQPVLIKEIMVVLKMNDITRAEQ
jgi:hypothetical protein